MEIPKLYKTYTEENNSVIKLEQLLAEIKTFNLEEQNKILIDIFKLAEAQNKTFLAELQRQSELKSMPQTPKRRKVDAIKKISIKEKKYINETIKSHQLEIEKLLKLSLEEFKDYILNQSFLNEEYNYYLLGLIRELNTYNNMADEAYLLKDNETLAEIKIYTEELSEKIAFLKQVRCQLNETVEEELSRIIFLETSSERAFFIEDIEKYKEYYASFAKLLNSLEEGNPYSPKLIVNNSNIRGLIASRDISRMTRIYFDKIAKETYIIISALIQKDDKNADYKNQLADRYKYYLSQKSKIIASLENPDFIERQEEFLNEAKTKLGLVTPHVKAKKNKGGNLR